MAFRTDLLLLWLHLFYKMLELSQLKIYLMSSTGARFEEKDKKLDQIFGALVNFLLNHFGGVFFDGRKDRTIVQVKKGDKYYRQTITQEHVTIIRQPESNYIGHISPESGTAKSITASLVEFFEKNKIDTEFIEAIGCDGTVVNTGNKGGVITLLEQQLKKPMQWLVCLFHYNELPLRHLFKHLDGITSGPRGFCGVIGKQLETCEQLPLVQFEKIDGNLPIIEENIVNDLSTDQKYLFEISKAICSGNCAIDLSRRDPGRMVHSRWLTMANRVLRLYVGSESPSLNLKTLATYIVKEYAPMWFFIKSNSSCKDGARHLWRSIELSRYLDEKVRDVVDAVIQRNGFFGHPENILLSMLSDERLNIRELGLRRILKARSNVLTSSNVIRIFQVPPFNFQATNYIDLIDWQECDITEPPLIFKYSDEELRTFVAQKEVPEFERFPCHTQSVERGVKLVTEASAAVCGTDARDGFIRARIDSRKDMPYFNTKSDFVAKK